jgi:CRP-like cAMP-binding protein
LRERLRAVPAFGDLDDADLDELAAAASEFEAPAGRTLIERGAPGSGLFVLEQGEVVVEAPEGTRTLTPGDVFGERALVGGDVRTARVRAQTAVRCVAIGRGAVEQVLGRNEDLADRLGGSR